MKHHCHLILPATGLILALLGSACPGAAQDNAQTNSADSSAAALLGRIQTATLAAKTLTADFTYTVTSVKQQQMVTGKMRLMKPNFARLTFSYMAYPAFPNLVASDGTNIFTFKPSGFLPDHTFAKGPFDCWRGALCASGALPGGGTISVTSAHPEGLNVHLWDAMPLQAFFDPETAIRQYLYLSSMEELDTEGDQELDGVTYKVLHHHFGGGNIAGGENSDFEQRLYVGPDNLIHMYVLEFNSAGRPGIQIMRLRNIKVNVPMTKSSFAFTLPSNQPERLVEDAPAGPK
jgi:outer membrane lipoprotein-sorting protein